MTDKLRDTIVTLLTDLIDNNAANLAHELRTSEDGTLGISFGIKLALDGHKVSATGKIAWARKFTDESQATFEFEDPNQASMPLDEDKA